MDKVIKWGKGSRFRRLLADQLLVWERMNHRFAPRLVWSILLPALPAHKTLPMEFRTTLQAIRCHFLHVHRLVDLRAEHGTWGLTSLARAPRAAWLRQPVCPLLSS